MSNVLTFPPPRIWPRRSVTYRSRETAFQRRTTALDQATVSAKSDVIENNRRILRIISNKGRRIDPDYPLPDAAVVIAAAMRCVRRRGRRITALPLGVRADLEALCKPTIRLQSSSETGSKAGHRLSRKPKMSLQERGLG